MSTKIEWCDEVWNPVTGCAKVSVGCKNCYAERIANRFWGERKFTQVQCHPERLEIPLHWKKPRKIFVNSMSDLFHEKVSTEFIHEVFKRMMLTGWHTYIVLTKRPARMLDYAKSLWSSPLPNVWLGVSVENQQVADERIPLLLQTPAAVRFVSVEPMLGDVYLMPWLERNYKVDWVICGSESGPGARPFDLDWARSLRDQFLSADVPFFLKQVPGQKLPMLDGKIWNEYPRGNS